MIMKKINFLLLLFIAGSINLFAQEERLDYDEVASLYAKSNKKIENPKKNTDPKNWLERGDIMLKIVKSNTQYLGINQPVATVVNSYGEPKAKSQDGNREKFVYDRINIFFVNGKVDGWEETQKICENSLDQAVLCYAKADSLDVEKKLTNDIRKGYRACRDRYRYEAALCVKRKDQAGSLENFKKLIAVNENRLDTLDLKFYYNAGLTAAGIKDMRQAAQYYQKAVDNKYKDSTLYYALKAVYYSFQTADDSAKALNTIKLGLELYPDDDNLLTSIVYHYIGTGQKSKAVEYIAKAKEKDPKNKLFHYVEGSYYGQLGDTAKARECYEKAISLDPNYFLPNYRLGEQYMVFAEELYKQADKEKDPKKFEEKKAPALALYRKALSYLETAYKLKPSEKASLFYLRKIYIRLGMKEKYNEVNKLLSGSK
jgi:tetratricopeptide (TPR) repeat protein